MPGLQALKIIALSTLIGALTEVASQHLFSRAFYNFDPTFKETFGSDDDESWRDYYMKKFPREVLSMLLVNIIRYYWYIFLERILPTRPRPKVKVDGSASSPTYQRLSSLDNDEEEQEKIIADWIAQGRIRRSSLSWCNILTKVLLSMTVANAFLCAVTEVFGRIIRLKTPKTFFSGLWFDILLCAVAQIFSPAVPLTFMAFIVCPAHYQTVFEDGVSLVIIVFFALFLGKLGPWLMSFDLVRESWQNGTQAAREASANKTVTTTTVTTHLTKTMTTNLTMLDL